MKSTLIKTGAVLLFVAAMARFGVVKAESKRIPLREIAITFAGSYEEIKLQTQQLAQAEGQVFTWIDVGSPRIIENWFDHVDTTPGIDGRLSHFTPPNQVMRNGYVFVKVKKLGEPTKSDGEQTRVLTETPLAVPNGDPPEGYIWEGRVRQQKLSQIVSWTQDWQYRALKVAGTD